MCDVKTKLAVVPNCSNLIATFDCSSQDTDFVSLSDSRTMKGSITTNLSTIVWLATLKSNINGVVVVAVVVVAVVVVAVVVVAVVVVVSRTLILLAFC